MDQRTFERDYNRFAAALEPFIFRVDGETYISLDCPPSLSDAYAGFRSAAIAAGYL